jgi:RNA polymerase sigma factor (sigma-70 family)
MLDVNSGGVEKEMIMAEKFPTTEETPTEDAPEDTPETTIPAHETNQARVDERLPDDLLDVYFQQVGQREMLEPEDEARLAKCIARGNEAESILKGTYPEDEHVLLNPSDLDAEQLQQMVKEGRSAFQTFVEANLRLVITLAAEYSRKYNSAEFEVLVQEGNIGLLRAVEKFDPERGFRFSTYARWWIKRTMQWSASQQDIIRLPENLYEDIKRLHASYDRLAGETDREPTTAELAEAANLTQDKVSKLLSFTPPKIYSLHKPLGEDEDGELADKVAVADDDPEREVMTQADVEWVQQLLSDSDHVSETGKAMLRLRYGLHGGEPETLSDIGRRYGVSRDRARHLVNKTRDALRKAIEDREG